jgi:mono/diheme cytochrome c family protein
MATLAFVALFVLLALGAVFLGFSGGPSGARKQRRATTRRGRRSTLVLFLAALVVLGFAIPLAVIAADKDRNSIPEADVKALTPLQEHGRELFGQRCRNCHTLKAANASAKVGPNLDSPSPARTPRRSPSSSRWRRAGRSAAARTPARGPPAAAETPPADVHPARCALFALPWFGSAGASATMCPGSVQQHRPDQGNRHEHTCLQANSRLLQCPAASAEFLSETGSGGPVWLGRIVIA